jgi:hypothetical protein
VDVANDSLRAVPGRKDVNHASAAGPAAFGLLGNGLRAAASAMVGTPDRSGLWLLARDPAVNAPVFESLQSKAASLGFDTSRPIRTLHSPSGYTQGPIEQTTTTTLSVAH